MAKKRDVKKDIEYLTLEVVSDCFAALELYPDRKQEEIYQIMNDAVNKGNELLSKVNQKITGDKKAVKQHFKEIYTDLIKSTDEHFTRLSNAIKK